MASGSNPRLSAIPCERMRGCSFAGNFVSMATIATNNASYAGSGVSCDHGLILDYDGWVEYDIIAQPGDFSVVVRFSSGVTSTSANYLIYNAAISGGANEHGFAIWVDSDGVKANYGNTGAGVNATQCAVDLNYADSEIHTITYVVDTTNNQHHLYVDSLAVNTVATVVASDIGSIDVITLGGDPVTSTGFIGTIYKVRVFNAVLTESEHDLYHADTLTDFMQIPYAVYRCDEICDDTDGHKIWDRTTNLRDLYKADRVTSAKFPTFETDKYSFDLVDDYISNIPTLPSTYTVVAALSTPQLPYPEITQENDSTLLTALSTEGEHWGYLHNLAIHSGVLTQLQLYHTEYMHMYNLSRGRASGAYHRLITEGTCKLAMFLDSGFCVYRDYSSNLFAGIAQDVTRDGANGCTFDNADSHILFDDHSDLRIENGTIAIYKDSSVNGDTIIDKGANYKLTYETVVNGASNYRATFNGSYAQDLMSNYPSGLEHIAVTFQTGFKPQFYFQGEFIGEGNSTVTPDDTDTTDLVIGNNNELNDRTEDAIKQVFIADVALTPNEIRALYQEAQAIGATIMETGNRIPVENTYTAATVDQDVDPGGPFQLIDVVVNLSLAASTSEDLVIKTIRTDDTAVTVTEEEYDLSLSTNTSFVFRFDKRLADNVTIGVDYPNSDGLTITVVTTYQLDDGVA